VPKAGGVLFADDASPPTIAVDTSHTFAMAHLEAFGTLPRETKKVLDSTKREMEASCDNMGKNDRCEAKKELDSTKRKLEAMNDRAAKIDHWRAKKIKMGISSADLTQTFLSYLETFWPT
jgi:hypothetical protein